MTVAIKNFFSVKDIFKTRNLAIMAMMVALKIILSQFTIYLTPSFKAITFAYLPGAMVSILYGPIAGLVFGFVGDTIGYIVKPAGPYFIGYALSEMLANFIYACLLYKKPITITRVLASRIAITVTITFGLNFLWNVIMYGSVASKYFTAARVINNVAQLPIYVALIMFFGKFALRLERMSFGSGGRENS